MSVIKFAVAALAMSVSLTALGAGAHGDGHGHGATAGKPGKVSDVSRTINVEMYDNYYEPESIEVKPGETVRFVVSRVTWCMNSTLARRIPMRLIRKK